MAINLASLRRGGERKPPRILDYSTHGLGKTSLAAGAPNPVFLQTEDGLGEIEADTFGILRTYDEIMDAIGTLYSEPHDFKTVVLDSADWTESIVWAQTCKLNGWPNIEHPGFGKGYAATGDVWRTLLDGLQALRDERGMAVIILAHSEIRKFSAPDEVEYDRYQPKLHKIASALIQEHVDCVWFMNYQVSITKDNPRDKDSRVRGVGGGMRVLYTTERPSHLAKNRYRMPDKITLPDQPEAMWPTVAQYIPYYNAAVAAPVTE